jgi:hypothetical protein
MTREKKKESAFVKVYLVLFFLLGIGFWFSLNASKIDKDLDMDTEINQKVNDILFSAGVSQPDIIKQYGKELSDKSTKWTQYYKSVNLKDDKQLKEIEAEFRQLARSSKAGLKKMNFDRSTAYQFYFQNRAYLNITFNLPQKTKKQPKKTRAK